MRKRRYRFRVNLTRQDYRNNPYWFAVLQYGKVVKWVSLKTTDREEAEAIAKVIRERGAMTLQPKDELGIMIEAVVEKIKDMNNKIMEEK